MNTLAIGFNILSILIVLLALVTAGIAHIVGKIKKNKETFHAVIEIIDLILVFWCFVSMILILSGIAILIADIDIPNDPFSIPSLLFIYTCCYLIFKEIKYGTIHKLLGKQSNPKFKNPYNRNNCQKHKN